MSLIEKESVIEVLKQCHDPELPVDLWNLGLIYNLDIQESYDGERSDVNILMTLTTPGCGMAHRIVQDVKSKLENIYEINQAFVRITFEPPWKPEMMTVDARQKLGFTSTPSKDSKNQPIDTEWE